MNQLAKVQAICALSQALDTLHTVRGNYTYDKTMDNIAKLINTLCEQAESQSTEPAKSTTTTTNDMPF